MTTVTAPLVHMNGTSKQSLLDNLEAVYNALYSAREALKQAVPNRRDYYPLPPDRWEAAVEQHTQRLKAIDALSNSIEAEMEAISSQE